MWRPDYVTLLKIRVFLPQNKIQSPFKACENLPDLPHPSPFTALTLLPATYLVIHSALASSVFSSLNTAGVPPLRSCFPLCLGGYSQRSWLSLV